MEGKEPTAKFEGYTVCPLITDIGKVMLAEFDWTAKPTPSFPTRSNTRKIFGGY
jgi:sulfide:quinone oxidoreductase